MPEKILNYVLFQLGWFACVMSSAAGKPFSGSLIAAIIILWHVCRAIKPRQELYLILIAMLIGGIWDSLLINREWLSYSAGSLLPDTAPYWIILMWALFATTLNLSLNWLKQHIVLALLLGAIAGPLAYYAGYRLGAVHFIQPGDALMALMIGWGILTPALVLLSKRLNGYSISTGVSRS